MKVLIVMDPGILVPPKGYGGIERIIEMLAKEYLKLGHEVHLLVTTSSYIQGCTMHNFGKEGFPPKRKDARNAIPIAWAFLWKHRHKFDLVHNFGRLIYLLPILNSPVKKIMSYQREITKRNIVIYNRLPHRNMYFTGCSSNLINREVLPGNWHAIYNACDFGMYQLQEELPVNNPLIFLGRIERIKGCHTAIAVSKATGNTLIIAGNISPLADEQEYFKKEIQPHIDGNQVKYVGPVNDVQKNEWLGKSKALLFPIEWNEPFGIVMIEAMACGTPVIGFKHGSVDEVIDEGVTGYKVNTKDEMIAAVYKIKEVERKKCRAIAESRFDISIIAKQYLNIN
jgi:glycosyltransferase involved in cell wall biosynthesis